MTDEQAVGDAALTDPAPAGPGIRDRPGSARRHSGDNRSRCRRRRSGSSPRGPRGAARRPGRSATRRGRGDRPGRGRRSSRARSWSSSRRGVGREVGQVEEGMADAGIFPVDQPEALAVIDQVGRQQVVVAQDGSERRDPPGQAIARPRAGRRSRRATRPRAAPRTGRRCGRPGTGRNTGTRPSACPRTGAGDAAGPPGGRGLRAGGCRLPSGSARRRSGRPAGPARGGPPRARAPGRRPPAGRRPRCGGSMPSSGQLLAQPSDIRLLVGPDHEVVVGDPAGDRLDGDAALREVQPLQVPEQLRLCLAQAQPSRSRSQTADDADGPAPAPGPGRASAFCGNRDRRARGSGSGRIDSTGPASSCTTGIDGAPTDPRGRNGRTRPSRRRGRSRSGRAPPRARRSVGPRSRRGRGSPSH